MVVAGSVFLVSVPEFPDGSKNLDALAAVFSCTTVGNHGISGNAIIPSIWS